MIPAYLYQYTTMDSVLAILENKTIRFTRLDSLNDLNEGCCGEYAHLKKYVYISSWSADERESIPMWSLYGKKDNILDEGVRIKVPTNLFTFDENGNLSNNLRLEKILDAWNVVTDVETEPIDLSDFSRHLQKKYGENASLFSTKRIVGPVKVRYLNYRDYINKYTSVLKNGIVEDLSTFFVEEIGFEKIDDWMYENEYRFWMSYPYLKEVCGKENVLKNDVPMTNCNFIDVQFNEKAIPEMEIKLAPNFSPNKKESFVEKLKRIGFTKKLQDSDLKMRFKNSEFMPTVSAS